MPIESPQSLAELFRNPQRIRDAFAFLGKLERLKVQVRDASGRITIAPLLVSESNAVIDLTFNDNAPPGRIFAVDSDATNYFQRVTSDGGTVSDETEIDLMIKDAKSQGWFNNAVLWFTAYGGHKLNAGAVEKWYNLGRALDATQSTASRRPTVVASVGALNARPALLFDPPLTDSGKCLNLGDLSSQFPTATELFLVCESAAGDDLFALFSSNGGDQWWGGSGLGNVAYPIVFRNARIESAWSLSPNAGTHIWNVSARNDGYKFRCDNALLYDGGAYTYTAGTNWKISDNTSRDDRSWRGHITEVIALDTILEDAKRTALYTYLRGRYA